MNESAVIARAWNTVLFDNYVRFRHVLTDGVSVHSEEAFRRHPFGQGARVLDVGCGFGDTTVAIAKMVGAKGNAVGVDCSERFIRAARMEAEEAKIPNASFFVADAQTGDLGGPYHGVFSRFGTLFFTSPGGAMRNIRRALVPGGMLTMIAWRRREDNPWLYDAECRVRQLVPVVSHEQSGDVHCGPGPFSMAGADTVSDILLRAGYENVSLERVDRDVCIGRTVDEAVDAALRIGPAGEIIRLAGEEGEKRKPEVIENLRDVLHRFERSDGVWALSSVWIVTANNPRTD